MKAIIIENERPALQLLQSIISDFYTKIEVVADAASIYTGVEVIEKEKPDIVFLDIELDDGKSFDLLNQLSYKDFYLIFTTAYSEFALQAFDHNAIDYVLKPYTPKHIVRAINRVIERDIKSSSFKELEKAINTNQNRQHIQLSTKEGIKIFDRQDIIYCEAHQAYCKVILTNEKTVLVSKSLAAVESLLKDANFSRPHTKYLVNLSHIAEVTHADGGYVLLKNGQQIPLSRRKKAMFINKLRFML